MKKMDKMAPIKIAGVLAVVLLVLSIVSLPLEAADATSDLLAKQSRLVQKWGVKKADEVVTKGWFGIGEAERITDLKKIVNAMPENVVDDFSPVRAVKFLGNKDIVKGAEALANTFDAKLSSTVAKNAAEFVRPSAKAGELFGENSKYKITYNEKGKLHAVENAGNDLGDFDDFYKINGKPIVSEVKTMRASLFDQLEKDEITIFPPGIKRGTTTKLINRLEAIKAVTGETPEVILYLPKGEAAASTRLKNMLTSVGNKGYKITYVEMEASFDDFEKAARRIHDETAAVKGGK